MTFYTTIPIQIFFVGVSVSHKSQSEDNLALSRDVSMVDISKIQNDYEENFLKYYGYARLFSTSSAAAEDLVQQSFVNIIDAIGKGLHITEDTFSAYMKKIIRNLSITNYRKESVQPNLRIIDSQVESAESEFELTTVKQAVKKAIEQLTETQRTIVVMHYFDGLKAVEIAEELNIDASSVRTHLLRARQSIAAAVNEEKATRDES